MPKPVNILLLNFLIQFTVIYLQTGLYRYCPCCLYHFLTTNKVCDISYYMFKIGSRERIFLNSIFHYKKILSFTISCHVCYQLSIFLSLCRYGFSCRTMKNTKSQGQVKQTIYQRGKGEMRWILKLGRGAKNLLFVGDWWGLEKVKEIKGWGSKKNLGTMTSFFQHTCCENKTSSV